MSQHHCYLLCIGVDIYLSPSIPDLSGCVQDATRFLQYLKKHHNDQTYQLHAKSLFSGGDQEPTRQNIIESIRTHLGQAQTGDQAILFYAGHGSKEKAPPSFGEADGHLQTLVPSDARLPNGKGGKIRHILDKEIRLLLHEVAGDQSVDLVVVQDSCHSTGATRQAEQVRQVETKFLEAQTLLAAENLETKVPATPVPRYVSPDAEARGYQHWHQQSLEELLGVYTAFEAAPDALQQLLDTLDDSVAVAAEQALPLVDHIHLAACGKQEFAYEIPGEGGVFTSNLLDILEAAQNQISYHDLFNRLRLNIDGAYEQTPDLYVRGSQWTKRHEAFLGDLLRQGALPPERDRDVFNGFYPVVPHGRNGWKIRAGELELLSLVQDRQQAIPEVFLQSESPKGQSNAIIESVTPEFSTVRLTHVQFDRRQHRNQLYGMVAARYLRRWRVPVFVEQKADHGSVAELFEDYGPRLALKNFQHDGGPAIRAVAQADKAAYTLTAQDQWLELRDAAGNLVLQSSAAQQTTVTRSASQASVVRRSGGDLEQYLRGNYSPWKAIGNWIFSAYLKNALAPIFDYLKERYEQSPQRSLLIFLQEAPPPPNPFLTFLQTYAPQLEYYKPFIKWTSPDKASHVIRVLTDGFALHGYQDGQASAVPVCRTTRGRDDQAGFEVILNLQKICKWQTVRNLYNKLQANLLDHHQFELVAKVYTDFQAGAQRPFQQAIFQSHQAAHYQNEARSLTLPLHQLGQAGKPFSFIQHPERPATVILQLDLEWRHLVGVRPVFVSTLLLDPTYAVLPLQRVLGSNLLPPADGTPEEQGTLHLLQLELPRPDIMRHFAEEVPTVTYYLKILMAYERFDVSGLLQDGLPPPAPDVTFFSPADGGPSRQRSTLTKVPEVGAPGSWMAFTIPLVVARP